MDAGELEKIEQVIFENLPRLISRMHGLTPKEYVDSYIALLKAVNEYRVLNVTDIVTKVV
jgi:hypothetical protein